MNTTQIISKSNQVVIDPNSFSIVEDYVKGMEDFDDYIKEKYNKPRYTHLVVQEINRLGADSEMIDPMLGGTYEVKKAMELMKQDDAIIMIVGPKQTISTRILRLIKEEDQYPDLSESEWERLNGYESEGYGSDGFMGWFGGASCDI